MAVLAVAGGWLQGRRVTARLHLVNTVTEGKEGEPTTASLLSLSEGKKVTAKVVLLLLLLLLLPVACCLLLMHLFMLMLFLLLLLLLLSHP